MFIYCGNSTATIKRKIKDADTDNRGVEKVNWIRLANTYRIAGAGYTKAGISPDNTKGATCPLSFALNIEINDDYLSST